MTETPEANATVAAATSEKPAPKKKGKDEGREEAWLIVTGPERGRRRAGHAFGKTAVELRVAELSDPELSAIKGDPELAVSVEMRPEAAADA